MGDIGDAGWIPGLGRSPGGGNGNTLKYTFQENFRDRGAWWVTFHMVHFWDGCDFCMSFIVSLGFPGSSAGKASACNAGDPSLIPGAGRYTGEGTGYPLQCSRTALVAQLVKNSPAMWETWV